MKAPASFSTLFSIGLVQEALFSILTRVELLLRVRSLSTECRDWVDAELRHADAGGLTCARPADVAAGLQVQLLHHFVRIEGARVLLPAAMYILEADEANPAHMLNGLRPGLEARPGGLTKAAIAAFQAWRPEWREGYGPLRIADGVTLVGQEGAVLEGKQAGLEVKTEGVRFESLHFPLGVIVRNGSLTMVKCTSTATGLNHSIEVHAGASLVMVDTRVSGCVKDEAVNGDGLVCRGKMQLTRCTVEENGGTGIVAQGALDEATAELVDCVIRKNEDDGVVAGSRAKVTLRGGTVSGNGNDGVAASVGGQITVSKEQPTEAKNNERADWIMEGRGVIEGVAAEKITRDPQINSS